MKHRELVDKVLELEKRIEALEGEREPDSWNRFEPEELQPVDSTEPLDRAYDREFIQSDIDPDYQG